MKIAPYIVLIVMFFMEPFFFQQGEKAMFAYSYTSSYIPAIDRNIPAGLETATFAMG